MKKLVALSILACSILYSCGKEDCPVDAQVPSTPDLDAIVIQNCYVLLQAAELYSAENRRNYYSIDVFSDTSSAGHTLIELIPEGYWLENPISHQPAELVNGRAANAGEIGYEPLLQRDSNPGYTITGHGIDSIIIILSNLDALEDAVRRNCLLVQLAAETWSRECYSDNAYGYYPSNVDLDTNHCGNRLLFLLPGEVRLINPFTKIATEPIDAMATYYGETGYQPFIKGPFAVGYRITGVGQEVGQLIFDVSKNASPEDRTVVFNCLIIREGVVTFMFRNNLIYPSDTHTDTTPSGDTVLDLMPDWGCRLPENPYTLELDQPVDRRAYYQGETGYEVIVEGGVNVGCNITGVGAEEGMLIFEITMPCINSCY